jgi:hypothetical protein
VTSLKNQMRNAGAWGSRAGRHRIPQIILGRNEWSSIKFGVFGLSKPKLPTAEEQRDWIDRSVRLGGLVGAHRLFEAELMLPPPEHFPDRYDRSEAALERMFHRVAARMHVNPAEVTLLASEAITVPIPLETNVGALCPIDAVGSAPKRLFRPLGALSGLQCSYSLPWDSVRPQ